MEELAMPTPGDVVDGKYRIEALVGQGAMGSVYRASHVALGHLVAIKFLRAAVDNDSLRARFVREARATMTLCNEHVVRVFDLGFLPSTMPYMVLEFLDGIDLRSLLDRGEALSTQEAVDYVLQVCEALAEAHLHGIVHRDLKPQNLFRIRSPNGSYCIKLLDFGVSKFHEAAAPEHELTASQMLLGSPAFMSPEQIRSSNRVDSRADIWSLGVVLYMLLGGGRPFDGEGLPSLCAAIMVDPPRPLSARCPAVPAALEAVLFRCLEKARDRRYSTVGAVATALEPFATEAGRSSAARVRLICEAAPPDLDVFVDTGEAVSVDPFDAVSMSDRTAEEPMPSAPPRRRNRRRSLAFVAGALTATVALSATLLSGRAGPAAASPAPLGKRIAEPDPVVAAPMPAPLPMPAAQAPPRTRSTRAAKPVLGAANHTKPKHGTVDRNGVPILD